MDPPVPENPFSSLLTAPKWPPENNKNNVVYVCKFILL